MGQNELTAIIERIKELEVEQDAGLSSKLCKRFFLGYFRKTLRVSNIEVA